MAHMRRGLWSRRGPSSKSSGRRPGRAPP